jgi:hypothetical protein
MMQEIVVGLIVAVAALVVARRYAPKAVKRAIRVGAVRAARTLGWNSLAARLAQQAEAGASCGGGCGNCGPVSDKQSGAVQSISVDSLRQTRRR